MKILQNIATGLSSRKCTLKDIKTVVVPSIEEMTRLCYEPLGNHKNGALAIAHCQVTSQDPLRFFVVKEGVAVVNPTIQKRCGDSFRNLEGCMSFADRQTLTGVQRHKKIVVSFTQVEADGTIEERNNLTVEGQLAIVFQHEIDHFNGKHIV